jgi:Uncharacterised nucleotidyltransferase/Transglutaminase-like superfamily
MVPRPMPTVTTADAPVRSMHREIGMPNFPSPALSTWLLGKGQPPPIEVLRTTRLAAYGYTALPRTNPSRSSLRTDYIATLGRHQRIKREIIPLLRAWRDAGIDILLFKGFHLAEFVYSLPGARSHGDVDVLIPRDSELHASRIARSLGWHEAARQTVGPSHSHNAFGLVRANGTTTVDVHREIIHVVLPWHAVQRRITDAVWSASQVRWWEGLDIRELSPVDMLLVGIVLQRCWSGDAWQLKPHDVIDYQNIATRFDVDAGALNARARELGCERTLAIFSTRFDPGASRLELGTPRVTRRWRWNASAFRERGLLGASELAVARLCGAPSGARATISMIPTVLRVQLALRVHQDLHSLLRSLTPSVRPAPPTMGRADIVAAVRWAMRLVGSGKHGPGIVLALALYVRLREAGWPVAFVSGIRRDREGTVGHVWIEHEGVVLPELHESDKCATFAENFRFPG